MNRNEQFHFGRAQHHFQSGNTSHALRHLHLAGTHFGAEQVEPHEPDEQKEYPLVEGKCPCGCGEDIDSYTGCEFSKKCFGLPKSGLLLLNNSRRRYANASRDGKSADDIVTENWKEYEEYKNSSAFGRKRHNPGFGVCATCGR